MTAGHSRGCHDVLKVLFGAALGIGLSSTYQCATGTMFGVRGVGCGGQVRKPVVQPNVTRVGAASAPLADVNDHCDCFESVAQVTADSGGGCTIVHVDSHPDLGLPPLPAGVLNDVLRGRPGWWRRVTPLLDIATWITPLVASGAVSSMVWIPPSWSAQMEDGMCRVFIGRVGKELVVGPRCPTLPSAIRFPDPQCLRDVEGCRDYWVQAGMWYDNLNGRGKELRLYVAHASEDGKLSDVKMDMVNSVVSKAKCWVLDFDEDFVSCGNPPLDTVESFVGGAATAVLSRILNYTPPTDEVPGEMHKVLQSYVDSEIFRLPPVQRYNNRVARDLLRVVSTREERWLAELCSNVSRNEGLFDVPLAPLTDIVTLVDTGLGLPRREIVMDTMYNSFFNSRVWLRRLVGRYGGSLVGGVVARSEGYTPLAQSTYLHRFVLGVFSELRPPGGWIPLRPRRIVSKVEDWSWHRAVKERHYVLCTGDALVSAAGVHILSGTVEALSPAGIDVVWNHSMPPTPPDRYVSNFVQWDRVRYVADSIQEIAPFFDTGDFPPLPLPSF